MNFQVVPVSSSRAPRRVDYTGLGVLTHTRGPGTTVCVGGSECASVDLISEPKN